jgi:hypothetical protein
LYHDPTLFLIAFVGPNVLEVSFSRVAVYGEEAAFDTTR